MHSAYLLVVVVMYYIGLLVMYYNILHGFVDIDH